jgi:hypothetical protein
MDMAKVRQLLADLDSAKFGVRERATKQLQAHGYRIEFDVRKFLAGNPSPEPQRRAEQVLAAVTGPVTCPAACNSCAPWRSWSVPALRRRAT